MRTVIQDIKFDNKPDVSDPTRRLYKGVHIGIKKIRGRKFRPIVESIQSTAHL